MHRIILITSIALILAGCAGGAAAPTAAPTASPAPAPTRAAIDTRPVSGGPTILRERIGLRKVIDAPGSSIRLVRDPASGDMFLLNPASGLYRLTLAPKAELTPVADVATMVGDALPAGLAIGPDGAAYVVANRTQNTRTQAVIRRGTPASGGFTWAEVAHTVPYPRSNTPFDHLFNGIVVSPDGTSIYLNSGSRTDHGEVEDNGKAFPDLREVPITSAIFRIPATSKGLELPNDEAGLKPYLFADGTRNAFDPAFAPNGDLFAGDNGPDADFPDELNWLREGKHYGFPWRFGVQDNPQQFPGYDATKDKRLSQDFTAVNTGTYKDDPTFPKAPGTFSEPVLSSGPDAAIYRADDGSQHDASKDGPSMASFTPHRSPLGLVFADDTAMPADMRGSGETSVAFILSWGAAGGTLTDKGQDLLYLRLTRSVDNYIMTATQIARDFKNPIDAVMIGNKLYVLEFGAGGAIWELSFDQ
jgi:glucose/arabinose dehydrogenase